MQLTSVFLVAAIAAFKINSAVALPYTYERAYINARDLAAYLDDELVARYAPEYYPLDARDFGDYDVLETRGPHFHHKIEAEQDVMDAEAKHIKEEQDRLAKQRETVSLQEQMHRDRIQLHKDNSFGVGASGSNRLNTATSTGSQPGLRSTFNRVNTARTGSQPALRGTSNHPSNNHPISHGTHGSRFQSRISGEQNIMNTEEQNIKAEQQRLATQREDMMLQEQIHKDRMALHKDAAFFRR